MNRLIVALAAAACAALGPALAASAFTPQTTAANQALTWLHAQQSADGTVAGSASRTEETVFGLVANGASVADFATSGKTAVDSLRSHIAGEEQSAGNIGSLIMAVSAAELDPTSFAGHNLLQDLACTYVASTGAYNAQLFNDALAVLAIPSGGVPAKAVDFLSGQQQADGGWEFAAGFGSDTNTTSIVLMALESANGLTSVAKDRALAYLKTQQQPSGGFDYAVSGDSDPNSDAAVIEALLAAGQDPAGTTWSLAGKNAVTDLLTFQYSNGGFGFGRPGSSATAAPDPFSTTQALPALASHSLPVTRTAGTMPSSCPAPSTTPAATPTPVSPSTQRLAQTGSPAVPAVVLGLCLIALGWRLRRRTQ